MMSGWHSTGFVKTSFVEYADVREYQRDVSLLTRMRGFDNTQCFPFHNLSQS